MSRSKSGPRRPDRVAPLIRQIISQALIAEVHDPPLRHVVITDVQMSPDVRIANLYFIALDEKFTREELEAALERSRGFLRSLVGQAVTMRHTPELRFRWDTGVAHGRHIEGLLSELGMGDAPAPAPAENED